MPIHDWSRVDAGLFHDFHQGWTVALSNVLNNGGLPADYYSLLERRIRGPTQRLPRNEPEIYADRANRITVRHRRGDVVAVIEIVSPGNKASRVEFHALVEKAVEYLRQGIHLLVIDLFSPGPHDPGGIHQAIWSEFEDVSFELPSDKSLTLACYDAGAEQVAYVEFVSVDDLLPDMPLYLKPDFYVLTPLEATYQATWAVFPTPLKRLLEGPSSPPSL